MRKLTYTAAPCLLAVLACAALSGCASHVMVDAQFPRPLVEPLPVRVGLIFDDELYQFVHAEELPRQSMWTIELGDANVAMLAPLFESMFMETRTVADFSGDPAELAGLDGVLRPALEKFEFDVPMGERDEFVEVWMQYRLMLYTPGGDLIAEWPVSGYGKAELDGGREEVLHRAAVVAMREVGAAISTEFAQQPQVSYWIEESQNATARSVGNFSD